MSRVLIQIALIKYQKKKKKKSPADALFYEFENAYHKMPHFIEKNVVL